MKFSKHSSDPSAVSEKKPKKPIFKRWWFWAIIVVVAIGALGSGGEKNTPATTPAASGSAAVSSEDPAASGAAVASSEETAPAVTEESKQAAKDVDAEISKICSTAEKDYKTFMVLVSSGSASDLDAYNTAKTLKSNLEYYNYTQLSAVKGDGIEDYKESASLYLYTMGEVADKAMDYLDDPITSKLSKFQDATGTVQNYLYDVVAKRLTFLSDAGLSSDEIDAITSSGISDTAN